MDLNFDTPEPTSEDTSSVPSYLLAADNHNYGNSNSSWYDPSTWGDTAVGAGKFAAVSLASGANSFYNTAAAVNNWLGGDMEKNDTATWISSMDDDLGQYYQQHQESADLAGFIATSLIPGLGSVKILNAGQLALKASRTGMIGANLSRATGLLAPDVAKYTALAAADLAQSSATFSALTGNTLKALAAGYGQAALESAVFETAVAATMFKSPVLENQDVSDLMKNIVVGTVLGGAIGGTLTGAKTFSGIKKLAAKEGDLAEKPFTHINEYPSVSPSERIIGRADDLENLKAVNIPSAEDIASGTYKGNEKLLEALPESEKLRVAEGLSGKYARLAGDKESRLQNLMREDVHAMISGGDTQLGNIVADSLVGADADSVTRAMLGAKEISRLSEKSGIERTITKAIKALSPEDVQDLRVSYVKLVGEDAGALTHEAPRVLNIADTVKNPEAVMAKVAKYGYKEKTPFDFYDVKDHTAAEARYIWADKVANLKEGMVIHENDLPLLESALDKNVGKVSIQAEDGSKLATESTQELFEHIIATKEKLAQQLTTSGRFTNEEVAKITNTRLRYVEGERSSDITADLLARQDAAKTYTQQLIDKGRWDASKGTVDISTMPTHAKVSYDTSGLQDVDGNLIDAMAYIKTKQKAAQQVIDNVFANHAEELADRFYRPDEKLLLQANREGAGPGLFSFANGNYHSLSSWSEQTGAASNAFIKKRVSSAVETLDPVLYKLASKPEAAMEWEVIKNKVASTTEQYVLNEDGTTLVSRKISDYRKAVSEGRDMQIPKLQTGAPEEIPIKTPEAQEAVAEHIKMTANRNAGYKELRAAQGLEDGKDLDTFYPPKPNPKDFPHFAFVVDPSVTGAGHVTMIHAASEKELEAMINKVPGNYKTITKAQSEEYHQALGDYDYERTLHENYIDSDLKSRGINTPFFPKTDPQAIVNDILSYHKRAESTFARELVSAKFEKEFTELRRLGEQYTNVASSRYGSTVAYAENVTKNPYLNYVKTALDISQMSEYPLLQGFNNIMEKSFSKATSAISDVWNSGVKTPADLGKVNDVLQQHGVKTAYYDAALNALANHSAGQQALKDFVGKANGILSTLTLRLDPFNAINNAVGANVLLGAETKSLMRAIEAGNSDVAGELAQLSKINVPGTDSAITSPSKFIASSMQRFFSPEGKELAAFYKQNGWITDISEQYKSMLDDLTVTGTEKASDLGGKISAAFAKAKSFADAGEKFTGNKLAEEFNRFVAADVMKQISDLGIKAGVIGEQEQLSYINTFVNRTQGNILASQRPLMFQGAVGQAIGLFQTYQFNMIQQLLRHVGEGSGKDVATLLGLQGTIYGMNGLPAFNFINQHIVGNASGNQQHRDLFDATYGIAGKNAGDWLLYGAASNMLKANIYTRGDINPRQVTVIPTSLKEIPAISAAGTFFGNLQDTVSKIGAGGNVWQTLLQGIEHNGISRPLAGLAQTLQAADGGKVIATNKKGNIMGANDLVDLSTLARIAGGKPFDEAIANDATYRIAAYQAEDHARVGELNKAIKTTLIAGENPSPEQLEGFVKEYVALGGKQKQFNKHMMDLYKEANTPQANVIAQSMKNPYAQSMQRIMGGNAIQDGFVNTGGMGGTEE